MGSATTTGEQVSRAESRGAAALWFGVLGAPLAWVIQLVLDYSLEEWWACSPATSTVGRISGLPVTTIALATSALLTAVAIAAGLVALRCYRRFLANSVTLEGVSVSQERSKWMALAGIMNSVLYLGLIVASFAPPFILRTCESSP